MTASIFDLLYTPTFMLENDQFIGAWFKMMDYMLKAKESIGYI
jgi:hypothetical protein